MPNKRDLWNAVRTEVQRIGASTPSGFGNKQVCKIYEWFLYSRVLIAIRNCCAQQGNPLSITIKDQSDQVSNDFYFRCAAGTLRSPSVRSHFLQIDITKKKSLKFEIHNNLYVDGISEKRHDLDVCVIKRTSKTEKLHVSKGNPTNRDVILFVECKYHRKLKYSLGREMIGLKYEMAGKKLGIFATKAPNTPNLASIMAKHNVRAVFQYPANIGGVDDLVIWLVKELKGYL